MTAHRPVDHLYEGRQQAIEDAVCLRCQKPAIQFSTSTAWNEYLISALCEPCQEIVFAELDLDGA